MKVVYCIPTIPPRANLLERALQSVKDQDVDAGVQIDVSVAIDRTHAGAWTTRNLAVTQAFEQNLDCDWIGFLDDDDQLLPHHTRYLTDLADAGDFDMVWGWFEIVYPIRGRMPAPIGDPFPQHRGRTYDPANPTIVPITYLVRAETLAAAVANGGRFEAEPVGEERGDWGVQDRPLIDAIHAASGGRLHASTEITWLWHHWGTGSPRRPGNTSGLPGRW